jgi:hypothetical protein
MRPRSRGGGTGSRADSKDPGMAIRDAVLCGNRRLEWPGRFERQTRQNWSGVSDLHFRGAIQNPGILLNGGGPLSDYVAGINRKLNEEE